MADKKTTILLRGKVGYEDEISPAQAAQIIAFLNADNGEIPELGAPVSPAGGTRGSTKKVENARAALDISGAKTNAEKIVALGAYILQDGGDTFKAEDVKAQFRRARENAPANFGRDLGAAIQTNWIAEDPPGEYYVTSVIQGLFDGGFTFPKSGGGTRARGATRRGATPSRSPKARGSEKPPVFAEIDEFPNSMDGFQPYSKMKSNKDKLLWAVKFMKDSGTNGLKNKEIEWLTDHLNAGIPNKQISAAFNAAQREGYANKSTQDGTIRITAEGEAYLATVAVMRPEA